MALTYEEQDQKVSSELFVRRVTQAAVSAATSVMAEASDTAGHTERAVLAQRVFYSPVETARLMARGVANNPNCGTGISDPLTDDDALLFVVASLWNAYANYTPEGAEPLVNVKVRRVKAPEPLSEIERAAMDEPTTEAEPTKKRSGLFGLRRGD